MVAYPLLRVRLVGSDINPIMSRKKPTPLAKDTLPGLPSMDEIDTGELAGGFLPFSSHRSLLGCPSLQSSYGNCVCLSADAE